jgi:hypothetical protein
MKLEDKTMEEWMKQVNTYIDEFAAHPFASSPVGAVLDD